MDAISSNYVGLPHRGISKEQVQKAKQSVKENSTEITVGGVIGTGTFQALRNSTKTANSITKLLREAKVIKASKQSQILKLFEKSKFLNSPVLKKVAAPLAGFAALSTVVGSTAKIADTCLYLNAQRPVANA